MADWENSLVVREWSLCRSSALASGCEDIHVRERETAGNC